jgi:hypothetical protein
LSFGVHDGTRPQMNGATPRRRSGRSTTAAISWLGATL